MSNTPRVQVRDLPTAQLRPADRPVDTFVQPARPADDATTENLIDALGFFNHNLSGLGTAMRLKRKAGDEIAAQRQENVLNLSTAEQKRAIAETGLINGEPIANARLKKMAGAADGAQWATDLKAELAPMNLSGMDVEAFVRKRAGEYMKGVNGDPFVTGGFSRYVDDVVGWASNQKTSQGLQEREQLTRNTTFQYLKSQVDGWVQEGVSPEQLHANVQQFYKDVGAGKDRITTPELIDHHVMTIASQLVDTNPEAALAMVTQGRKGADGKDIGSLAADPRYSAQVASMIHQGKKVVLNRDTATLFHETRQANLKRVLIDNDTTAFHDVTGPNGKTLTQKEQETQFLGDLTANLQARVDAGEITQAAMRQEVARRAGRLNLDDPFIKDELDGVERRYMSVDAANDPATVADIEERAKTYLDLKGSNKNYVMSQVSDKSRDFYEAVDVHKRYMGSSDESALEFANQVVNPTDGMEQNLAFKRQEIGQKVRSKLSGWFTSHSMIYDLAYASQIEKVADLYAKSGMNLDTAIDAATEQVFDRTPSFEGDPLIGLEGQNLPADYQDILKTMGEDYKAVDARGKTFEGAITYRHLEGGTIAMVDRENGTFLEDQDGKLIVFNVNHMRKLSDERQRAADAAALKATAEARPWEETAIDTGNWIRDVLGIAPR
ncbi:hypothetical protein [Aureimonas sp. D3]|uniref:hypothetical protein n=1 Tax=Aureimonas sp. D3 TaxID=1638164 RepID=UPI000783BF03|nr:hypothetical protein [Aureimonas sp. D3]